MGYEVTFYYHKRDPEGGYNTDEKHEFVKKIGKSYDSTPLSKAAKVILSQLSRRDIWVVDVDLKEFVKREISFKESASGHGIILKGKKFTIDDTEGIQVDEEIEEEESVVNMIQPNQPVKAPLPSSLKSRNLFSVICSPEIQDLETVKKRNLTPDQKYIVHSMRENPAGGQFGNIYSVTDDKGNVVEVDEKFFIMAPKGLIGGDIFDEQLTSRSSQPKLLYDGGNSSQPQLRRPDRSQIPAEYAHIPIEGEESNYSHLEMQDIRG